MDDNEVKPWQCGYDLEHLKSIANGFASYNAYSVSPFSEIKKNDVAVLLRDNKLLIHDDFTVITDICSGSGDITAYLDVIIARKEKGDRIIRAVALKRKSGAKNFGKWLKTIKENVYGWSWIEDAPIVAAYENAGFRYVNSKITSHGEIKSLYYKQNRAEISPRGFPKLLPQEYLAVHKATVGRVSIDAIAKKVSKFGLDFANHYSNYNKDNSWSAVALRGYYDDPTRIEKPDEMNKKWLAEHAHESPSLQDTKLRAAFPEVDALLDKLKLDGQIHRIRFMRLRPKGGELQRHTDQVDKDTGVANGKLARLHFPIITNDQVIFTVWDFLNRKHVVHMKCGECWYLDTRKPHMAVNGGETDRIHLVVDVESTPKLRSILVCA